MEDKIENPLANIGISITELNNKSSLREIEISVAKKIRNNIQTWIENFESKPPVPNTLCRNCGKISVFHSMQEGNVHTQFGLIRYQRAFYLCPFCYQGTYPLDERLNPYQSLARMRTKILAGEDLPVSKMAKAWGLGTLDISSNQQNASGAKYHPQASLLGSISEPNLVERNEERLSQLHFL